MVDARDTITKAIQRSQHCQRNWDLDRQIPDEDHPDFESDDGNEDGMDTSQ